MEERFFSSKQASQITGCTLRQLQYWRDKEVIVPFIQGSGTGKTIYYSASELVELAVMVYLLSVGLSFEIGQGILQDLKQQELDFTNPVNQKRFMIVPLNNKLKLIPHDQERAIAFLEQGKAVIPVWLDEIHQNLQQKLNS